jgi:mono/diheme cytochrome c family protein
MPMSHDASRSPRRQRYGLIATAALGLLAGGVSLLGTRDSWPSGASRSPEDASAADTVVEEPTLPLGPHRTRFQASCVICHSARLPLSQPDLHREKWVEIVHKMVAAYGAPLTPEEEVQIVDYLLAVQESRS